MAWHALLFQDFDGNPITGLTPTFVTFGSLDSGAAVTPPDIEELEGGFYRFDYNPFQSYFFVVDGGASITDGRVRWVRGVLEPNQATVMAVLDETLTHLRSDLVFERRSGKTYQVLYKDGVPFREWEVTDQLGRSVEWPTTSRLPVNRRRTK